MSGTGAGVDFSAELRRLLRDVCPVSDEECALLKGHFELLVKWNRRMNLTAVREALEAIERHYCESVFLAMQLPEERMSVIDVGSGAGFPGVGVAVMRRRAEVTLVESNHKKAAFLKESTRGMTNVRVLAVRAEAVQERYDWLVSRAVAWSDLPSHGRQIALLTTEPGPEFDWRQKIPLPWGERRILLIGGRLFRK